MAKISWILVVLLVTTAVPLCAASTTPFIEDHPTTSTTPFVENPPKASTTPFVENSVTNGTTPFVESSTRTTLSTTTASRTPTNGTTPFVESSTWTTPFMGHLSTPASTTSIPVTPTSHPAYLDGLQIKFDHPSIVPGMTDQLTLTCSMQMDIRADLSLVSLVILMWNPQIRDYEELAILSGFNPDFPTPMNDHGARLSGYVDNNGRSYLTMEWVLPGQALSGNYVCEANLYTTNGHTETLTVATDVGIGTVDLRYVLETLLDLKNTVQGLEQNCTCLNAGDATIGNITCGNDVIGNTTRGNHSIIDGLDVDVLRNLTNESLIHQEKIRDHDDRILVLEAAVRNLTRKTLDLTSTVSVMEDNLKMVSEIAQMEANHNLTRMLFHDTQVEESGMRFYYSYISFNDFAEAQAACSNLGGLLVELNQTTLSTLSASFKKIQSVYTGSSYIGVIRNGSEPWTFSSTDVPANYDVATSNTGHCMTFDLSSDIFMSVSCSQGMSRALCGVPN